MFSLAALPKYSPIPQKSKPNFPSLTTHPLIYASSIENRESCIEYHFYRPPSNSKKPLSQFAPPRFVYYTLIEVGLNQRERNQLRLNLSIFTSRFRSIAQHMNLACRQFAGQRRTTVSPLMMAWKKILRGGV